MVITTGFFDGVHLGHRHVIDALVRLAAQQGDESMVVTFWPHPRTVLQNDAASLRLLTSYDEKRRLLHEAGVDHVELVEFTREFSRLSTQQYLEDYIIGRFGGSTLVLGYDNRIGKETLSSSQIESLAHALGIEAVRTDAVCDGPLTISSSKIREALAAGDVARAASMLGYRYMLHGVVVSGNMLGRTIGFPTANMQLYEPLKLVPANGVYFVEVETGGKKYYGMTNIGKRPTLGQNASVTIETHIFDFEDQIYGLDISIRFIRRLRDEARFDGLDALREQLAADKTVCLSYMY